MVLFAHYVKEIEGTAQKAVPLTVRVNELSRQTCMKHCGPKIKR